MGRILRVYTDGSASPNPGKGAYSYVVLDEKNTILRKYSMAFTTTTNNRMELRPLIAFLQWAQTDPIPLGKVSSYEKIIITSDSQYLILGVQGRMIKWKANGWNNTSGKVVNLDLWKKIDKLLYNFHNLEFKLVKGHSGDQFNDMVDKIAVHERITNPDPCIDLEYTNSLKTKQLNMF